MIDPRTAPYAATTLRVVLGILFLAHAGLKLFVFTPAGTAQFFASLGLPGPLAYLVILVETIGGLALIAGFYSRIVAVALIPVLLGALVTRCMGRPASSSPIRTAVGNSSRSGSSASLPSPFSAMAPSRSGRRRRPRFAPPTPDPHHSYRVDRYMKGRTSMTILATTPLRHSARSGARLRTAPDRDGQARCSRPRSRSRVLPNRARAPRRQGRTRGRFPGNRAAVLLELRQDPTARLARRGTLAFSTRPSSCRSGPILGAWLAHAIARRIAIQGASDHLVSEAIYLADPEGNGIEIYADRPHTSWRHERDGRDVVGSARRKGSYGDLAGREWTGFPMAVWSDTSISRSALCARRGVLWRSSRFRPHLPLPRGSFFGSGGYHHHLAANIWNSRGAPAQTEPSTGLADVADRRRHGDAALPSARAWRRPIAIRVRRPPDCSRPLGHGHHLGDVLSRFLE